MPDDNTDEEPDNVVSIEARLAEKKRREDAKAFAQILELVKNFP